VVLSGGDDHILHVWDLNTRASIAEHIVRGEEPVRAVAVGEMDGRRSVRDEGALRVATAVGERITISRLTPTGDLQVLAVSDVGSPVLALAAAGPTRLLAACKDGILSLSIPWR
jgi:hypothetical protein